MQACNQGNTVSFKDQFNLRQLLQKKYTLCYTLFWCFVLFVWILVRVRLQLHGAIYRPDSFVLTLHHCVNFKATRYESTNLNRIAADKLHYVIVAFSELSGSIWFLFYQYVFYSCILCSCILRSMRTSFISSVEINKYWIHLLEKLGSR